MNSRHPFRHLSDAAPIQSGHRAKNSRARQVPTRLCVTVIDQSADTATELVEESRPAEPADYEKLLAVVERRIVVTAGAAPTLAFDGHEFWRVTAPKVKALNPIGSGDAFTWIRRMKHIFHRVADHFLMCYMRRIQVFQSQMAESPHLSRRMLSRGALQGTNQSLLARGL